MLNAQNSSIKFTCEEEVDGSLPLLDVRVTRRDSRLEFDVYRKPINTQRCIPITSCHSMEHKMAAFHSMLHQACNLPFSRENFKKKMAYNKETAGLNVYTDTTIDRLMSKHHFKRKIKEVTTLSPIRKKSKPKRAGLTFHPSLSRKIYNIMAKHNIQMVSKVSGKLFQVLWSPKDVVERAKSGIYEIYAPRSTFERRDGALTNDSRSIFR
jgi:hypothetical protein